MTPPGPAPPHREGGRRKEEGRRQEKQRSSLISWEEKMCPRHAQLNVFLNAVGSCTSSRAPMSGSLLAWKHARESPARRPAMAGRAIDKRELPLLLKRPSVEAVRFRACAKMARAVRFRASTSRLAKCTCEGGSTFTRPGRIRLASGRRGGISSAINKRLFAPHVTLRRPSNNHSEAPHQKG